MIMPDRRFVRVAPLLLAFTLVGCGAMPEPTPPTAPPAAETPPAASSPAATPAPSLTLGEVAQGVEAAWSGVESYRVVRTGAAAPIPTEDHDHPAMATPVAATPVAATPAAATPVTDPGQFIATRDIILPDVQHMTVTGLGENDFEAISDGDTIFVRGPLTHQLDPEANPDDWMSIDPATMPEGSLMANLLGGMPAVPAQPFAGIAERLAPQEVRELGTTEVGGRTCQTYGAADTKLTTGQRVDYVFGIDDDDLPCFIETRAGTTTYGHEEFSLFNDVPAPEVPAAATPVAVPAVMASPVHHD